MNLKYYLRGLGTGILVTVILMGIALGGKKETLSDNEIKERAKALGMIEESTRLADAATASPKEEVTTAPKASPKDGEETALDESGSAVPTSAVNATSKPTADATSKPTADAASKPTADVTSRPTAKPTPKAETLENVTSKPTPEADPKAEESMKPVEEPVAGPSDGTISIQIARGDDSYAVCRKLEEAGLIISASDFDRYLYENGYDKRLNIGTYKIPEGTAPQEIARMIAGLQ